MSRALWCVTNGRAAAPPAMACSVGVSTSTKPRSSRMLRMAATIFERPRNVGQRLGVVEQVEVALPVAQLDVGHAVPLLGGRQQGLGQERQAVGEDGQLAGLGLAERAVDADQVAEVELAGEAQPASPTCFLPTKIWIRPVQSRRSRKMTFPWPRRSTIRPATRTRGPVSRCPARGGERGRRRSPDGRRTGDPRGRARAPRSAAASRGGRLPGPHAILPPSPGFRLATLPRAELEPNCSQVATLVNANRRRMASRFRRAACDAKIGASFPHHRPENRRPRMCRDAPSSVRATRLMANDQPASSSS